MEGGCLCYFSVQTRIFGHINCAKWRGFHNADEMDAVLLGNINSTVGEKDQLWILGDFAWKDPEKYRKQIKCKNTSLSVGNHDVKFGRTRLQKIFNIVDNIYVIKKPIHIVLCHYAMKVWPGKHRGHLHAFGHSHNRLADPEPNSLDVGVDCHGFKPISLEQFINNVKHGNH